MGIFGRLLGIEDDPNRRLPNPAPGTIDNDQQAIERYRYMARTAPPETLEQAYAEGFSKLTPEQREKVRAELSETAPAAERAAIAAVSASDTQGLARAATRAEIRQPGTMERALGPGAVGFGANLLSSFAMGFVGSMVAQSFFSAMSGIGADDGGTAAADSDADDSAADDGAFADDGGDSADDGADFGDDFDV
jgi:hypothetical protein